MPRVVVLTDLHISDPPRPGHPDTTARLRAALAHIAAHAMPLDLVVLCGDLTHMGDPASYALLRDCLEGFALPVQLMIGNHDTRAHFLAAFPDVGLDAQGYVQSHRDIGGTRLVFIDSAAAPLHDYPAAHAGLLTQDRLDWLDECLDTDKDCILFLHHPPAPTGFAGMDVIRLVNGDALLALARKHGSVRHIVCGHVHRTISGSWGGIPFSIFKSLSGQQPMLFDSTNTSLEVDEPPAYGILDISPRAIVVHSEDFGLTDLAALRAAGLVHRRD